MNLGTNDYILIFNTDKDYYEDVGTLFTNLKPKDKKVV